MQLAGIEVESNKETLSSVESASNGIKIFYSCGIWAWNTNSLSRGEIRPTEILSSYGSSMSRMENVKNSSR